MKKKQQNNNSPLSREFLAATSHSPGVYIMSDHRDVLYVGKAKDLRKRLAQYANFSGSPHSKTGVLLSHIKKVETILTTTEKEALLLEASLIKKYRPRYNVILRDDKNYPLIKITTQDEWPRIVVTRKRIRDKNRYFGPYSSSSGMWATLKMLYSLFPLRRCRTVRPRSRPCLNYQMKKCLAPCAREVNKDEYNQLVRQTILFLEGKNKEVIEELENKMTRAANQLKYEEAARWRDLLTNLQKTLEQQIISDNKSLNRDIFGIARQGAAVGMSVIFVRAGHISGSQNFFIADPIGDDKKILKDTLMLYYSPVRQPPGEILLPSAIEDETIVKEQLEEWRQKKVRFIIPKRGKKNKLVAMAQTNAEQIFSEQNKKEQGWQVLSKDLSFKLRLKNKPDRIECLDISNLAGKQPVGSLVCFVKGEADKRNFRHYRIRLKDEPDDYAMMREVIIRRMESGLGKNNLPDMLLLDGGKGQLSIGVEVLSQFDLLTKIDLVAIAKEKEDEGEKLFLPGRKDPVLLPSHSPSLRYLMRIRDESHRFGITFHRKLRNKAALTSPLDKLPGVGPKRKQALLKTMGSYKRICAASVAEIENTPGIGKELAKIIYQQLRQDK